MADTALTTDHARRATQLSRIVANAEAEYGRVAEADDAPGGGSPAGRRRLKALAHSSEAALLELAITPAPGSAGQQAKARALKASLFPSPHSPSFNGAAGHLTLSLIHDLLGDPIPVRAKNPLLDMLRPLARDAGVVWLKTVQAAYSVETLSELSNDILTQLIVSLRQNQRELLSTSG